MNDTLGAWQNSIIVAIDAALTYLRDNQTIPAIDAVLAAGSNAEQHQLINLKALSVSQDASGIAIAAQNTNLAQPNSVALCGLQYALLAVGMTSLDNGKITSDGSGDLTIAAQNLSDVPGLQYTDSYGNAVSFGGMDTIGYTKPPIWASYGENSQPSCFSGGGGYTWLGNAYYPFIADQLRFDQLGIGYQYSFLACYYNGSIWSIVDQTNGNTVVMTYADDGSGFSPVGHYTDAGNGYNAHCDLVENSPENFFTENWVCGDPHGVGIGDELVFQWPAYNMHFQLDAGYPLGYFPGRAGTANTAGVTTRVNLQTVPATPTSIGTQGMFAVDATYLYLCTGTNVWKRIPFGSW